MGKALQIFFLFLLICGLQSAVSKINAQPTTQWIRTFPDTTGFRADSYAMVLDDSGNVYITGDYQNNGSTINSYCTIKYSSSGVQEWVANYYSNNDGGRYAHAIALDRFSNIYVTGYSYEIGHFVDFCTIKYNNNGIQQWIKYYDDPLNNHDEAEKIAVDNAGNIYVSGFSRSSSGYVITTIKYSSDGDTLWTRNNGSGVPVAYVNGMVVDEACNIYITGDYNGALTIKYDSTGNMLWSQVYGSGMAESNSIAIDKYHNVYIAGLFDVTGNFNRYDFLTIKYSLSGSQQWVRRFSVDSTLSYNINVANSIAVDSSGNLIVNGFTKLSPASSIKVTTLKYTSSGSIIWFVIDTTTLAGLPYMVIDNKNNIYVSGSTGHQPSGAAITTISYDSSGTKLWTEQYYSNGVSQPLCLKVDNNYNILITGSYNNKMLTIKYSQPPNLIQPVSNTIPKVFGLFQNYPNPFNPVTKIKFHVPYNTDIKISVYDMLGREIKVLLDKKMQPGIYEADFNGENLSSGVYFYKLETEKFSETKKMTIIK